MNLSWRFFAGAVIMGAYLLISHGAPLIPVFVGCVLAALMTWRKMSRQSAQHR